MWVRLPAIALVTLAACREKAPTERPPPAPTPIETAIARDLGARFRTTATVRCEVMLATPVRCKAQLADGTELPIAIENASKTEWGWRVDGLVIDRTPVQAHVEAALASIHAPQTVDCGRPLQVIPAGGQIVCKLGGGGTAFVVVRADGTTSLELELDPTSAAARGELLSADRERELARESKELDGKGGDRDEEADEAERPTAADAGVP